MNAELEAGFRQHLEAIGRAKPTITAYLAVLSQFVVHHAIADLRHPPQEALLAYFTERKKKPRTLERRYFSLRAFYRWLVRSEKILLDPMLKIPAPKRTRSLPSRIMSVGETRKMLEAVPINPERPYEFRNRLMLELLYSCSLRRGELVALDIEDYDPSTHSLRVRASACKTRTGRIVPVGSLAAELLERYLKEVRPACDHQALFANRYGVRLSAQHVTKFVTRLRLRLTLRTKATSHSFRKSSATHMLRNSAPLVSVSRLLGHTDITATQLYTKVYPADIVAMHRAHHPREKQKNITMPDLRQPDFLFKTQSHRLNADAAGIGMSPLTRAHASAHPRDREALPELRHPLYMDNTAPRRLF